ncbi:MAG: hypothetical protein Q9183_005427, partial [Haloplaca sp. 2 TL-2023]
MTSVNFDQSPESWALRAPTKPPSNHEKENILERLRSMKYQDGNTQLSPPTDSDLAQAHQSTAALYNSAAGRSEIENQRPSMEPLVFPTRARRGRSAGDDRTRLPRPVPFGARSDILAAADKNEHGKPTPASDPPSDRNPSSVGAGLSPNQEAMLKEKLSSVGPSKKESNYKRKPYTSVREDRLYSKMSTASLTTVKEPLDKDDREDSPPEREMNSLPLEFINQDRDEQTDLMSGSLDQGLMYDMDLGSSNASKDPFVSSQERILGLPSPIPRYSSSISTSSHEKETRDSLSGQDLEARLRLQEDVSQNEEMQDDELQKIGGRTAAAVEKKEKEMIKDE